MRQLNWKPEQVVAFSVLGNGVSAASARILELSGKRLRLAGPDAPHAGAAVRLEADGQLVLGEVLYAEPEGFWIEIRHVVLDTAALSWRKQGWQLR
jgi:hypothetical protein